MQIKNAFNAVEGPALYTINNHMQTWDGGTKNYYRELIYARLFTCSYKCVVVCAHRKRSMKPSDVHKDNLVKALAVDVECGSS